MPKVRDKGKNRKRDEKSSKDTENGLTKPELMYIDTTTDNISKKQKKSNVSKKITKETIEKSKQLLTKQRTSFSRRRTETNISEPRVCGNGKPMPSLAELEKMYEDSDEDTIVLPVCKTPEQPVIPSKQDLESPKTLKELASKVMNFLNSLPEPIAVEELPPSVVPERQKKKDGIPYIVGCNKRKQYNGKPKSNIGKGDKNYGIKRTIATEDSHCEKRRKKSQHKSEPTSIFNAQSNEIAQMLKSADNTESNSDGSVDSCKTLAYEFSAVSPSSNRYRNFSPIPSTSKDKETFLKNDIRFNESLLSDNSQSDIEVIEIPCETIILEDDGINNDFNSRLQITESGIEEISYFPIQTSKDSSPEIIDVDYYSSFNLNQTFDSGDCEIIDVDDVIAENKAIIDKYRRDNSESVTNVPPTLNHFKNDLQGNIHESNKSSVNTSIPQPQQGQTTGQTEIGHVVENFFYNHAKDNSIITISDNETSDNIVVMTEGVSEQRALKDIMKDFIAYTKTIFNAVITNRLTHSTPPARVIDLLNITSKSNSESSSPDNPSVSNSTLPKNNLIRKRTIANIEYNDSVIINVPDNNVSTTNPYVRKRSRKSQKSLTSIAVAPTKNNNATLAMTDQPVRSIGDCPICMDNLSNHTVASTICGHIFCMKCIEAAIKAGGKKCPTCRKTLKGTGYHQLFL